MIIAAYAGTGKTWTAEQNKNTIDLPYMPYRWLLPVSDDMTGTEKEQSKGAPGLVASPLFPYNYLYDILQMEQKYRYVIIPSNLGVIKPLLGYGRIIALVYPSLSQQEEYRKRYLRRGNTEEFISIFVDGMDHFLAQLEELRVDKCHHVILQPGQYLSDVMSEIEQIAGTSETQAVEPGQLAQLQSEIEQRAHKEYLFILERPTNQTLCCRVKNIADQSTRDLLCKIGRRLASETYIHRLLPAEMLENFPFSKKEISMQEMLQLCEQGRDCEEYAR